MVKVTVDVMMMLYKMIKIVAKDLTEKVFFAIWILLITVNVIYVPTHSTI